MTGSTDWLSAVAILAAGVVLGTLFIAATWRRKAAAKKESSRRSELASRRDLLVEQLRELDDAGVGTSPERTRLEMETADVLRQLDGLSKGAPKSGPAPDVPETPRRAGMSAPVAFGAGVVSTLLVGGLAAWALSTSEPKAEAGMPSGGAERQGASGQKDQELRQLEAAVASNPDDPDQRIALARAYFSRDNLMGVFEQSRAVLAKNPDDPRALAYNAAVRMAMGQDDQARQMLEKATALAPKLTDAWVALASLRIRTGDRKGGAAAIDSAIREKPEEAARLRQVLADLESSAAAQGSGIAAAKMPPHPGLAGRGAMPADHPPMPGRSIDARPGHPTAAAIPGSDPVRITLDVDPAAKVRNGVVFVIARGEGEAAGHPVAVKRVAASSFPTTLDLGDETTMMGGPLPKRMTIEVRLDLDGDAGTNDPSDPKAVAAGVAPGAKLTMTLR